MTRCSACGTLFDEVRWVSVLPRGTVCATRGSCPACSTGRLPRWGIAPDLILRSALRVFLLVLALGALWLVLACATDTWLRCLWPLLGLLAARADSGSDALPTFVRRWVTRGSVCAALLVVEGAMLLAGGPRTPADPLGPLEWPGAVFWIPVASLVASFAVSLRAREPGGEERILTPRRRMVA